MKRKPIHFWLALISAILCLSAIPVSAATDYPVITLQPQNPCYLDRAIAEYSAEVYGQNLKCTWHLKYKGTDYNISDTSGGTKPWMAYAGAKYGPQAENKGMNYKFTYSFYGLEKELNGSILYAVISNGSHSVNTRPVALNIGDERVVTAPPVIRVPASIEVCQNDLTDIYCSATVSDGSELSYLWYETPTGEFKDMVAIDRGAETQDTLHCDTSTVGTRYYICAVNSAFGGYAYSSVIPVKVTKPDEPTFKPIEFTTRKLPDATKGKAYKITLKCSDPTATFGIFESPDAANNFKDSGLVLTESGVIKGTPAKAGTYSFAVYAAGDTGQGHIIYTLKVNPAKTTAKTEKTTGKTTTAVTTESTGGDATTASDAESAGSDVAPASDAESAVTQPQTGDRSESDASESSSFPWWVIIVAAVILAAGGTAVALILRKK